MSALEHRCIIERMDPRYPIGQFRADRLVTAEGRRASIETIAALPRELREALAQLPPGGLDTTYRTGGWTKRQVVHHLADSHLNAYVRVRLALTEETPTIRTYEEARWAELHDARTEDPSISLTLLDALHARLVSLFQALRPTDFGRKAHHPLWGDVDVDWLLQMYAWHGRHHTAHIALDP